MLKRAFGAATAAALIALIPAVGADAASPRCKPGEVIVTNKGKPVCMSAAKLLPPRGINPPNKY